MTEKKLSLKAWSYIVWGLVVLFFFTHYIVRVAPSTMATSLMQDLHASEFQLGNLSSFFLYVYAPMQIPVGMLIDRYGPRRLLTLATLIAAIGCFIFAYATTLHVAEIGCLILGLGCSFGFVSALKLARAWFPHTQFGFFAGATEAIGSLGAGLGGGILAFAMLYLGWRGSMSMIAAIFMLLSFLIFLVIRDRPPFDIENLQTFSERKIVVRNSLGVVLRNPQSWYNAFYVMMVYATTTVFAGIFGVSFLQRVYHISLQAAAFGISLLYIGITMGAPLMGLFSDYLGRRRPLMFVSAISGLVLLLIIAYVPGLPVWLAFACLFLFGLATSGFILAYAVSGEINPYEATGTSVAFANMASILGGTLLQPLMLFFLGFFSKGAMEQGEPLYSAHDFRLSVSILIGCFVLAIFFAFKIKETYGKYVAAVE